MIPAITPRFETPYERAGVLVPGLPVLPHGTERHPVPGGGSRAVRIEAGDTISVLDVEGLQPAELVFFAPDGRSDAGMIGLAGPRRARGPAGGAGGRCVGPARAPRPRHRRFRHRPGRRCPHPGRGLARRRPRRPDGRGGRPADRLRPGRRHGPRRAGRTHRAGPLHPSRDARRGPRAASRPRRRWPSPWPISTSSRARRRATRSARASTSRSSTSRGASARTSRPSPSAPSTAGWSARSTPPPVAR